MCLCFKSDCLECFTRWVYVVWRDLGLPHMYAYSLGAPGYQLLQVLNGNSYLVVVCGCSVLCCIYVVLCCSVIGFVWFGVLFLLWLLVCTYVRTYLSAWNVWPLALYLCSCSVLCSSGLIQCTNVFLPPDMWRLGSVVD